MMGGNNLGRCEMHVAGLSIGLQSGVPNRRVDSLEITLDGPVGDRHAGPGLRQVALLDATVLAQRHPDVPGEARFGLENENIALVGLAALQLRPLDVIQIGGVLLEVTYLGSDFGAGGDAICADHEHGAHCAMERHGVFGRVIAGGTLAAGDEAVHWPRRVRARVITMSDRASRGKTEDLSGPCVMDALEDWCREADWESLLELQVLPDDEERLTASLTYARDEGYHVVVITGGTGVGARDITPEVVLRHADKVIPGIMEHIRMKYGAAKPLALLSRSVAVVMGATLVFAIPGSPKGAREYMREITPLLEHLLLVVRGIDPH